MFLLELIYEVLIGLTSSSSYAVALQGSANKQSKALETRTINQLSNQYLFTHFFESACVVRCNCEELSGVGNLRRAFVRREPDLALLRGRYKEYFDF